MEFVQSIIAFFTPYLGEYAQYAPIAIGALLAIVAYKIKPRVMKKMGAEELAKEKQDTDQKDIDKQAVSSSETTHARQTEHQHQSKLRQRLKRAWSKLRPVSQMYKIKPLFLKRKQKPRLSLSLQLPLHLSLKMKTQG